MTVFRKFLSCLP